MQAQSCELARSRRAREDQERPRAEDPHAYRQPEGIAPCAARTFTAKGERKDTTAEQLVFEGLLAEAELLEARLAGREEAARAEQQAEPGVPDADRSERPWGRRRAPSEAERAPQPSKTELACSTRRGHRPEPGGQGRAHRAEESSRLGHVSRGARCNSPRAGDLQARWKGDEATPPSTEATGTAAEKETADRVEGITAAGAAESVESPAAPG